VLSRAELLGAWMLDYGHRIGVAGAHGKSTVTAMLCEIFTHAGLDPTVLCGAVLPREDSPLRAGRGAHCIFEACEYGDSFLRFSPTGALLLNVEYDHADYFESEAALQRSFARFAALPGEAGLLFYNAEDAVAERIARESGVPAYSFGVERGDLCAHGVQLLQGCARFSLLFGGRDEGVEITLRVPGRHNLQNALAAALCARVYGISPTAIAEALSAFRGAGRRMEYKGLYCGARVYSDYAHHPRELCAAIDAARAITPRTGRVIAVFQPHTYTRTRAFWGELCGALRKADSAVLLPVYPAREKPIDGVNSAALANAVGESAVFARDADALSAALSRELGAGDTLLLMGAGDIEAFFCKIFPKGFTL
jgi:UDP-N-acetylmuramate--alanine ligase